MDYGSIIDLVAREAGGISREAAERAVEAMLRTLADRLPRENGHQHLVREVPDEMKPWLFTGTEAERFDAGEFLSRVARREGTDVDTALLHTGAVFAALGRALTQEAVSHMATLLPVNHEAPAAGAEQAGPGIMPASVFWDRVGRRLGLDGQGGRYVAEAVLETLAERITAGEAEDLIAELDPPLHVPLRRGLSSALPDARRMPLETFLRRVAMREGADMDDGDLFDVVYEHVRAVFATLAEAVTTKRWSGLAAGLSGEYRGLLPAPSA
jgi:uncharacterized protein (DUF2267 family)